MFNYILTAVVGIGLVGYAIFFSHPSGPLLGIYNGVNGATGSIGTNTYRPVNFSNQNNPNGSSIIGNVSSINGAILSVNTIQRTSPTSTSTSNITFIADASSARFVKQGATSTASISDIKIGDRVIVQGTIKGTSISAKLVIDTLPPNAMIQVSKISTATSTPKSTSTSTKTTTKKK